MLYPLYVHHDLDSAWSGIFPDLPGCFTASDTLQGLPEAAQDAVCAHYGFDNDPLPEASSPDQWLDDPDYQGGFWMLVDIDQVARQAPSFRAGKDSADGVAVFAA